MLNGKRLVRMPHALLGAAPRLVLARGPRGVSKRQAEARATAVWHRYFLTALCLMLSSVWAGVGRVPVGTEMPGALKNVGIDQKLNERVPFDTEFTDDTGKKVRFGAVMGIRPVVVVPVYFECPMLCHMALRGVLRTVRAMTLNLGQDFDIIAVSFDPSETAQHAARKKIEFVESYDRPSGAQGSHFLTGDESNIRRVMDAIGFRYTRDPSTGQWAHASAAIVLTPDGRVARYFYGVEYSARDLRFGLIEASKGKIGTAVDQILLFCYHYDPITGKYGLLIKNLLRAGGIAVVLGMVGFWVVSWRQNRRRKFSHEQEFAART